jgi:hypothetical protein
MFRHLARPLGAGLILFAAQICGADETFPVVHNEPIIIRVLSGRDGHPLARARVILTAGYDQRDIEHRLRREEALTDEHGNARLPNALANFPLLRVSVVKKHLCQADGHGSAFSIERIRRDGLSAPNRCGTVSMEDAPGVFAVWVKTGKAAAGPVGVAKGVPGTAVAPDAAPFPAATAAPACHPVPAPPDSPDPAPTRNRRKYRTTLARA